MDWSNFTNLYNLRQTIANSTNQSDKNEAKKKEKEILSKDNLFDFTNDGKVDIDDLISFSMESARDLDSQNGITEDEENFLTQMKDALYDKLAKEINKNKDLKVSDMMELEEKIRELNSSQKESAGEYLEKIQNRMVSNLTSQFFVTKETDSYKENAKSGAIEIWEAQNALDSMNVSENNPFNDKFENLLAKLEGRVIRTLSEDYTSKSIEDAKKSKNIDALVKKSDSTDEEYDPSKFSKKENILYYDSEKFTGMYSDKYYQQGEVLTGIAYKDGKYYEAGIPGNGEYPNINGNSTVGTFWVIDGQILWQDQVDTAGNTVRYNYESYILRDKDGKVTNDAVYSSVVTFVGKIAANKDEYEGKISSKVIYNKGQKVSTETYTYNSDGSYAKQIYYEDTSKDDEYLRYTTTGELFNGNGAYDSKLYENDKLKPGFAEYGNRLYIDGITPKGEVVYNATLYFDGEKVNGIYNADGKYYVEGKLVPLVTGENGIVYRYGVPAQGVIEEDGKYNYYENGAIQSEIDSDFGKFATDNFIENIKLNKEDGSYIYSSFTGTKYIDGQWRNVEYSDFEDEENFIVSVSYEHDIALTNKIEDGELKEAKYNLAGFEVPVNINGSKSDTGIDYSLQYTDIDGEHPVVQISNAIGDNLTYVYKYELKDGNYNLTDTKIVIGSINDIQSGKVLTEYPLSDENSKISYEEIKDKDNNVTGIKVTDESLSGVKIEQTFGLDGKVSTGLVTFKNLAQGANSTITINSGELCKVNGGKVVITVPQKDGSGNVIKYIVTTYNSDGTQDGEPVEIADAEGVTKSFVEKINVDLADVQDIKTDSDGKVTKIKLDGTEYDVTYPKKGDKETILLKSGDTEKQFLNNVVIYEKSPSFNNSIVTIERAENGKQTKYRTDFDENSFTEYKYDSETGKLSQTTYKNEEKQTITNYAPDGKTVTSIEITEYNDGKETSVIKYAGSVEDNKITYKKEVTSTGYEAYNYNVSNGKVIDKEILVNAVAANGENAAAPKTLTKITYKSDGTTVKSKTVTTYTISDSSKIDKIEKFDENNQKTELTTYNSTGKTVEKYKYSSSSNTPIQTTTDTYNTDDVIVSTVVTDNVNDNQLLSRITYENGVKSVVETFLTYDDNGIPKTSQVEEYRGGILCVRKVTRTYTDFENNKYTISTDDEVTEIGGVTVKQEQKDFAKAIGLTITDIAYNDDGSLKTLAGMRFNDNRISVYSDWSVNENGQYSYLEEITLAGNGTSKTDDDVTLITKVKNNNQEYARIAVADKTYPVNVNGSQINDSLDVSISTELDNDTARYIYVNDVLFDGAVRKRTFTLTEGKYVLTQSVALGSLEDINDSSKSVPTIPVTDSDEIKENSITIKPTDNKIPIYIKGAKKYDIELKEGETFTITKDGTNIKTESTFKNENQNVKTTYVFDDEGGYSKTISSENNKVTYVYGTDGVQKGIKIGDTVLSSSDVTVSFNNDKSQITVKRENSGDKIDYELVFDASTGKIKSGKLQKGSESATVKEYDFIYEDENNYLVLSNSSDCLIYDTSLNEINETLNLTYEKYQKLNQVLKAYNKDTASKITLSDIKSTPEFTEKKISFVIDDKSNYTEKIVYKISDETFSKIYTIGNQTFSVPRGATISTANNKITIQYTTNSKTTTIELSKAGENSTYYDKVKYNDGDIQEIEENAAVTIRNDGTIVN